MTYRNKMTWNDRWIMETVFPGKRGGFFVEVGACNGINGSSAYVLEKELGWSGIVIEPDPGVVVELKVNRSSKILNCCLAATSGEVDYFRVLDRPGYSGVPALNHSGMEDWWKKVITAGGTKIEIHKIKAMSLEEALGEIRVVDYLAMDCEGSEYSILSTFPFDKIDVRAISIEGYKCDKLLLSLGYRLVTNPFSEVTFERYYLK